MERKVPSILCRFHEPVKSTKNPRPLVFYEVQQNEEGEKKFIPSEPVKPSMADDFNVINNKLYGRCGSGQYRMSCDPVDVAETLEKVL